MHKDKKINYLVKISLSAFSLLLIHQNLPAETIKSHFALEPSSFHEIRSSSQWGHEVRDRLYEAETQQRDIRNQINLLQNEERSYVNNLRQVESEIRRIEVELRQAQRELQAVERDLNLAKRESASKEQDVQNIESQISQLERSISTKQRDAVNSQRQIDNLKREVANLDRQRDTAKLHTLKRRVQELQEEIPKNQAAIRDYNERIARLEQGACSTHCQVTLIQFKKMRDAAVEKDRSMQAELHKSQREVATLERVETMYQQKSAELQRNEQQLMTLNRTIQNEESQLNQVRGQLPLAQKALAKATSNENRLQNQQRILSQKERNLANNLATKQRDQARIQADLSRVESRLSQARQRESILARNIAELRSRGELERKVLVGDHLSFTLNRELANSRVEVANIDRHSAPFFSSLDSIYLIADSLRHPLSRDLESALVDHIERGGLLMVLGNPEALLLEDESLLRQLMAFEIVGDFFSNSISGRGILNGLSIRKQVRALELRRSFGSSSSVREVLSADFGKSIGLSSEVRNRGRILSLALDIEALGLNSLSQIESALCRNLHSFEKRQRGICL